MSGLITSHADLNFLLSVNSIKLVATPLFGPNVFMIFRTLTLILTWKWGKMLQTLHGNVFFYQDFLSQTLKIHRTAGKEGGTMLYSFLSVSPAHEHSDIYLQLCMWDDYHLFLIASLVTIRLLLDELYHFIELPFWLIDDAMLVSVCFLVLDFCYSILSLEANGFELPSTITITPY